MSRSFVGSAAPKKLKPGARPAPKRYVVAAPAPLPMAERRVSPALRIVLMIERTVVALAVSVGLILAAASAFAPQPAQESPTPAILKSIGF